MVLADIGVVKVYMRDNAKMANGMGMGDMYGKMVRDIMKDSGNMDKCMDKERRMLMERFRRESGKMINLWKYHEVKAAK